MVDTNRWRHPVWIALFGVIAVSWWLFRLADPCLATEISNHFTAKDPAEVEFPILGEELFDKKTLEEIKQGLVATNPYGIKTCPRWRASPSGELMLVSLVTIVLLMGVASGWMLRRRQVFVAGVVAIITLFLAFGLEFVVRFNELTLMPGHSYQGLLRQMVVITLAVPVCGSLLAMAGAWITRKLMPRG